ncbi:DMT family transporter [Candidatus Woesearchaeota archaeon]|nr:DMT family transporter [Candidatus Woesearchaeota archaeon]
MVFIVSLCFSFTSVFTKILLDKISSSATLFLRFIFVVVTFPIVLKILGKSTFKELIFISGSELKHFFFLSIFLAGDMILFFNALYFISVSKATFLFLTYPILSLILARIFLKESITKTDVIATIISFSGIVVMFWKKIELQGSKGEIMVLAASLLWSAYIIMNRYLGETKNHYRKTYWLFLFNAAIILIALAATKDAISLYALSFRDMVLLLSLAIFSTLIPYTLLGYAAKYVKSSTSSIILLLGPIFGILLSFIILKERPPLGTLIGGFFILISAFISTYSVEKLLEASKRFPKKIKSMLFWM